ncbi:hypothetical protein U9M48_042158 [Paspalum notatum var. saurae]|uniref:Uncharacterized protein n=1 Tax=Paspalum notatum var. saurae TaxID=547442 RepID=A0AAQ3UPY6_PASNO
MQEPPTELATMATGAIASLLPKLFKLLKQEYGLQKGVREKIESLSRELEVAQALLRKVGDVPWEQVDELVRLWARDVREASYAMEDIVDTFLVHVDGPESSTEPDPHVIRRLRKKMGKLFKKSKARRKIAIMIQDMNNKLKEVEARHDKGTVHKIAERLVAATTIDPRLVNLYKKVTELVGIEGPRNELMDKLSIRGDDGVIDKKMKVVSVVGVGGLGKTTLAKAVYDHLKPRFEYAAFVSVGQNPDVKKVLKNILTDIDKGKYMLWNTMDLAVQQLVDELKEFVKEKRYLIVIDDIWDKKPWKLIRCAFQESDCGSRVIITTRINEVAECANEVYKIQPLSPENSEKLLYARIQGVQKYFDSPSTQACSKILKKCRGVPLAIITIASLLASKPSEYWFEVYSSIGFGHGDNEDVDNTRQILSYSYYDLPSHLKPCLLYLSIFPEDSMIEKNGLIWTWVAEGFIIISKDQEAEGVGLFELGERYFYDLINRSMIQPQESNQDYEGYVNACSVHDMVLDLINSISSNEHFVTVLRGNEKLPRSIVRRLALQKADVHISGGQVANNNITVEKVRSLIADGCKFHVPSWSHLPVLRVLDMTNSDVKEDCDEGLLDGLGSLLRLRYLRVEDDSRECITELPKEVRYLKFLQTLNLSRSYGIKELPEEVGLLTQLVCLRLSFDLPAGVIGKLTSLQELKISWPHSATTMQFGKELGSLRELRVLYCCIEDDTESVTRALLESLGNLHNIRELTIANPCWRGMSHAGGFINCQHLRFLGLYSPRFSALPPWIKPSLAPNLSFLAVKLLVVNEQDMETLARLPELRSLRLFSEGDTKLVIVNIMIHTEGVAYFPKLRSLKIQGASILFHLPGSECNNSRIASTVMPSLESLDIEVHVRYLIKEHGFENLGRTSLQRVTAKVHCGGARVEQVVETQAALRHTAAVHPKHPTLRTILYDKNDMVSPYQELPH